MAGEAAPNGNDFRMDIDPEYPEPPIENVQGMSQRESDGMNQRQTIQRVATEQARRNELISEQDKLRQRYARDGFKEAADKMKEQLRGRRGQA